MQTTAFAFATNDEINDMTFYTTRITNRGATKLVNTYFGQWVDADLGFYNDDYVGCDVGLSLGYCYNGDDNDEGVTGYGLNPPSVGVDFFEGPTAKVLENGVLVERELGMSKFVYYNNDANTVNGNPSLAGIQIQLTTKKCGMKKRPVTLLRIEDLFNHQVLLS